MLENYIKTLILSTMVLVIGNNSNYCYGMENNINNNVIKEKNEEINTNSIQNSNSINKQQPNINKDNNEDYKHLFDINYNKDYYDQICNECIQNVSSNKQEYKIFMKNLAQVFDDVIESIFDFYKKYYCDEDLYTDTLLPKSSLTIYAGEFDAFHFADNMTDNRLRNNNYENVLKYFNINKTNPLSAVVISGILPNNELLSYLSNGVRKLKAQTLKALETSILNGSNVNININNEKIIKESQKILDNIAQSLIDDVEGVANVLSKAKFILNIGNRFKEEVSILDIFHYNGSKLQTRFNNLHNKVMATLDKMINDIDNNRLVDETVLIPSDSYQFYSRLTEDKDSDDIKSLFNDFNNTNIEMRYKRWQLKGFLNNFKKKLKIVKDLTDRKINQQMGKYHTLLDRYFKKDDFTEGEYKKNISIWNYILITCSVMQSLNNVNHIKYKLLVQCCDFLKEFGNYYGYVCLTSLFSWNYILKYNPGQSPQETFKKVLDNNNDSFDLDGNDVNNLEIKKKYH